MQMAVPRIDSQHSFWFSKKMIVMVSIPIFVAGLLLLIDNVQLLRRELYRSVQYQAELVMWESREHLLRVRNAEQILVQQLRQDKKATHSIEQIWDDVASQYPFLQHYWVIDSNGKVFRTNSPSGNIPSAYHDILWDGNSQGLLYTSSQQAGAIAGWAVLPDGEQTLIWTALGPAGPHVTEWLGQPNRQLYWFDDNGDIVYSANPLPSRLPNCLTLNGIVSSMPVRTQEGDLNTTVLIPGTSWHVLLCQPQVLFFQQLNYVHIRIILLFVFLLLGAIWLVYRIKHDEIKAENQYRMSLEQVSREADKMAIVSELAASVAHEIRNPITSIKGFMQILHQRNEDQNMREFTDIIVAEVNRVEGLIEGFLNMARPSLPHYQLCDIKKALLDTAMLACSKGLMQHVDVVTDFITEIPLIRADCNQLKQVFINFSTNAIQAMPEGGILKIRAWFDQEHCQLVIQFIDKGQGIEPDVMKRLGQRFVTTKPNGTGLGLSVSYQIIRNHHGKVEVQSEVSHGTTFTISLPAECG